ncbi:MAG: hypothetical protein AAGA57_00895 [Planctomycetota bacterium]
MYWPWIVGVAVLFFVGLPLLAGGLQLVAFRAVRVTRMDPDQEAITRLAAEPEVGAEFLREAGFEFVGGYVVKTPVTEAGAMMWRQGRDPAFIAALLVAGAGRVHVDIESILSWDKGVTVTTGTAKDGWVVPKPPGSYVQTFTGKTMRVMWELHQEAEGAVAEKHGVDVEGLDLDAGEVLERSVRRDAAYVSARPWLMLLMVWRYWVGKHLLHETKVADRV